MPASSRRPHHVAGEHPVDREVLADVAEEVDRRERRGPVVVVDHRRRVVALEAEERLDLRTDPLGPVLHRVERVERPLPGLLGVADHAGGAADQRVRRVAGVLEPAGGHQLDQVAHVEARRGRVEADIEPDAALGQRGAQRVAIRGVGEQAAPLQVVEEGRVDGHGGPFFGSSRCASGPVRSKPAVSVPRLPNGRAATRPDRSSARLGTLPSE